MACISVQIVPSGCCLLLILILNGISLHIRVNSSYFERRFFFLPYCFNLEERWSELSFHPEHKQCFAVSSGFRSWTQHFLPGWLWAMSQFHGNALLPSVECESHSVNRRLEGPVGWPHRAGPGRACSLLVLPFWEEKLQRHHVLGRGWDCKLILFSFLNPSIFFLWLAWFCFYN